MNFIFPDTLSIRLRPTTPLVSLADMAERIGADRDAPPSGLQKELDQGHALIDGPHGRYGRCFRAWSLKGTLHDWPSSGFVRLAGGIASTVGWQIEGTAIGGLADYRHVSGLAYMEVPEQPTEWDDDDSILDLTWTAGPEKADVQEIAKGAMMRLVSSLWADRIDPGKGRLVAALDDCDAVLERFNALGM